MPQRRGFTTMDRTLHQTCADWFGDAFTNLTVLQKGPRSTFMQAFEAVRTAFDDSDEQRSYRLALRMEGLQGSPVKNEHYDNEHGHILLYSTRGEAGDCSYFPALANLDMAWPLSAVCARSR